MIGPIDNASAQKVIVANHYLHRRASCSYAFGWWEGAELLGVIMFGSPVSPTLCRGICGPTEAKNVIELTRLWCDDRLGHNTESQFIMTTVRSIPKEIIVAFADPTAGHVGTVYQACSWIYTGLGPMRKKWQHRDRLDEHFHRAVTGGNRAAILTKYGDAVAYVPAVRKHRYIYFNAPRLRRHRLIAMLRYPICPYPKLGGYDIDKCDIMKAV